MAQNALMAKKTLPKTISNLEFQVRNLRSIVGVSPLEVITSLSFDPSVPSMTVGYVDDDGNPQTITFTGSQ